MPTDLPLWMMIWIIGVLPSRITFGRPGVLRRISLTASEAPIDFLSISDPDDQDEQPVVFNVVDDPIVTDSDPVQIFGGMKLRGVVWAWVVCQPLDPRKSSLLRAAIELTDLTGCGG